MSDVDMDGGYCYGCEDNVGYRVRHDVVFTDSRTGRKFCHECVLALASWELDGRPEPDEMCYPAWINHEGMQIAP